MKTSIKLSNNRTFTIEPDQNVESPRHWDNLSEMVCFHKRYSLGDKHSVKFEDYNSYSEMMKKNSKKGDIVLPLYMMDHSGLTISTTPFGCTFDSGQIGFIKISLDTIRKTYGRATKKNIEIAMKVLVSELETYNQYISGEVYTYSISDQDENIEDSCSGFYGLDFKNNGMLDNLSNNDKISILSFK